MDNAGRISLHINGKTVGRLRVLTSNLGLPPVEVPDPNSTNGTDDVEPLKNFGLNMHKIHAFLMKFKPTLINNFNEML